MPKFFVSLFSLCLMTLIAEELPREKKPSEDLNLRPFEEPLATQKPEYTPWIVGNIFTPVAFVVPPGHFRLQLTSLTRSSTSSYDNDRNVVDANRRLTINTFLNFKVGVTKFMDVFIRGVGVYRKNEHVSTYGFGDFRVGTDFQLYTYPDDSWLPAVKLVISEFFPTGKYQHLNPAKLKTDAMGTGSFAGEVALTASHLYHIKGVHYLGVMVDVRYRMFAPVHVHGFNTYGGAKDTNGRVYLGQQLLVGQGFQFSLSKKWTIATDFRYRHLSKRKFSGFAGGTPEDPSASMKKGGADQFIFAPQIEYSWTPDIGAIIGSWFTFAGRNAEKYYGAIAQFNWYY